jgi:hypothetical protein
MLNTTSCEDYNVQIRSIIKSLVCGAAVLFSLPAAQAGVWSVGDLYTSSSFSSTIRHYDVKGNYLDSMSLASQYGENVKGMAFDKNGWLYAVSSNKGGMAVTALDSAGNVHGTFSGPGYITGNISYGKIAFGKNGEFYVAGSNNLVAFTPGESAGKVIYTNNQVFDVKVLPSGNLLVLSAYSLEEITPAGTLVRALNSTYLVDARGVEYDPVNNDIFVTMLGYSDNFFQLMRLNGTTGVLEAKTSYWYGDDLLLTDARQLIAGSRTQAPGMFDLSLNLLGKLQGDEQMFVAQLGAPASVPEPASAALLLAGIAMIGALRRRRA